MLSTEGTGWFDPEKLTEVIDTYENSHMYLPGKYSKFPGTGSAKPGRCLFRTQNVGNTQTWVCSIHVGRLVVSVRPVAHHFGVIFVVKLDIEPFTVRSVRRSAHPKTNVVLVEDQPLVPTMSKLNQSNATWLQNTNLIGARLAQAIPSFRFPDNSVYETADRICEQIARKQDICSEETVLKCVDGAMRDSNAGDITTNEPEIRLVNQIDFSIKGGRGSSIESARIS